MTLLYRSARHIARQTLRRNPSPGIRFISSDVNIAEWKEKGWLDERELLQFGTLHEMQDRACALYADHKLFATHNAETDKFEWMSYNEYASKVETTRAVLHDLNVGPGSKVGIISNNRWEWAALAAATYSLNASMVPMYEAQLAADWTYILNDSGAHVLMTANDAIMATVRREVLENTPNVQSVLSLDAKEGQSHAFATLMAQHADSSSSAPIHAPTPEDLANLIYTSGTTGKPKGVELTHDNFTSNVKAAARTMVEDPKDFIRYSDCSLAFLPWAHSYGQTCELWMSMAHGASMGISRGIPTILDDLQQIKPTVLFSVPTLYKKVYDGVQNLMETSSPIRKSLMQRALSLGQKQLLASNGQGPALGMLEKWQYSALNTIVLNKIRDRFGGNLRHGFVAGAACPKEVLDFMDIIGIPICEGYGLTETSPIIAINSTEHRSVGTVGRPIGGVTVYIVNEEGKEVADGQEGEICCSGPNIMKGYYKNPEATAEVITTAPDGKSRMFHTGDLGCKTETGFIKVTGRLKEQYKLENGKYVVPTPIEEAIGMSRFLSQVVLTGANRPFNVALLVPEWSAIRAELKIDEKNLSDTELAQDSRVKKLIDNEIRVTTARLKKFEIPQAWAFVAPFTAANNMLTPKMSIRRHKVISTYDDLISELYGDEVVATEKGDAAKEEAAA